MATRPSVCASSRDTRGGVGILAAARVVSRWPAARVYRSSSDPHTSAVSMTTQRLYARLREDVNIRLRRGAWYPVLKVEGIKAILHVGGRNVVVAAALLEFVKRPPPRWTVVAQTPSGGRKAPSALGERYGVCPSCGDRAPLVGRVRRLRCTSCKFEFDVAWEERYLA